MTTRTIRFAVAAATLYAGAVTLPALAQYANEYIPPKLLHEGHATHAVAGPGKVVVKVEVQANGAHRAVGILKSTNHGDNAAAMDIANTSTYRPAHRGKKAVPSFYDFALTFHGAVAAGGGGAAGRIDALLHQGKYQAAKSAAQAALANNPNNAELNSELGTAEYFLTDYPAAAAAFSKVPSISNEFKPVAEQSLQMAAQHEANDNPQEAVNWAQRAISLAPSAGAFYSLGAAQLGENDSAAAVATLTKARKLAFADSHTAVKDRISIDSELLAAQVKAGDTAGSQQTAAELKRLDPSSHAPDTIIANQLLAQASAESKLGDHQSAIADDLKAAQTAAPNAAVTGYVEAAFEESKLTKPDYTVMQKYAEQALAAKPGDAIALFAEGVALYGQYATTGGQNASLKKRATDTLNQAKAAATAQNDPQLLDQIDAFIKTNVK